MSDGGWERKQIAGAARARDEQSALVGRGRQGKHLRIDLPLQT